MNTFTRLSKYSLVMLSSVMLSAVFVPADAFAANLPGQEQTIRITSTAVIKSVELVSAPQTTTYVMGDGFKASEISFRVNYSDGTSKIMKHDLLKFTANGQDVTNGYKWKTVGTKHVVVTYKGYETDFNVEVKSALKKAVRDYELVTTKERLEYKVGDPFQADDLYFRFYYKDGTQEDFGHNTLYIHTADGQELVNNYKFKVAGNKTVVVECQGYRMSYDIYVAPAGAAGNKEGTKNAWFQSTNGTWQYYKDGNKVKGWLQDGGAWYYLDKDGDMTANGWLEDGGKWYYLNKAGHMLANGWMQDGGTWYYLDKDGSMLANGWIEDNGAFYYLNADGSMAANTTVDGFYVQADGRRQ